MIRLGVLCAFVVAVGMLRPRLTTERAWWLVSVGGAATIAGFVLFLLVTRWLTVRGRFEYATTAFLHVLRRIGLPLLGLAFFLLWTLVYVGLWAHRPVGAFTGLPARPRFSDFFYYSVSTALISPPGDILAQSRGARSATMIEMLTAFAVLTAYLASFVDWQRRDPAEGPPPSGRPRAS
jgi:hypothetical protein